jgi:hypothetical protein
MTDEEALEMAIRVCERQMAQSDHHGMEHENKGVSRCVEAVRDLLTKVRQANETR